MFPLTLSGWVTVRGVREPDALLPAVRERVMEKLEDAHASSVWLEDGDVRFTAGLFRGVWNWNVLVPFGSGRIRVEARRRSIVVKYRLRTLQLLGVVLVMLALLAAVTYRPGHIDEWLNTLKWLVPVFLVWFFGANYLTAAIHFPIWLRVGLTRTRSRPADNLKNQLSHSLRN